MILGHDFDPGQLDSGRNISTIQIFWGLGVGKGGLQTKNYLPTPETLP
jgi:hypothetical protein